MIFFAPHLAHSFSLTITHLLVQIYFSPLPSAAVKIKDSSYNAYKEITVQLFAKTTPALQVKKLILIVLSNWYSAYQKQCTVRISLVKNKLENNY